MKKKVHLDSRQDRELEHQWVENKLHGSWQFERPIASALKVVPATAVTQPCVGRGAVSRLAQPVQSCFRERGDQAERRSCEKPLGM